MKCFIFFFIKNAQKKKHQITNSSSYWSETFDLAFVQGQKVPQNYCYYYSNFKENIMKIKNRVFQYVQSGKKLLLKIRCKWNLKIRSYKPADFLHCPGFLWGIISVL